MLLMNMNVREYENIPLTELKLTYSLLAKYELALIVAVHKVSNLIIALKVINIVIKCVNIPMNKIVIHAGFRLLGSLHYRWFDHPLHHLLLWRTWYVLYSLHM